MSDGEQDEQIDELYDFIYRDPDRFASYSAQFFDGHLTSFQKTSASVTESHGQTKLSVKVASGEMGVKKASEEGLAETIIPHDVSVLDVLSKLEKNNWIAPDFESAGNGDLFLARGTLFFADAAILSLMQVFLNEEVKGAKTKAEKEAAKGLKVMADILPKATLPTSFYLISDSITLSGTLKSSGLDEPVSSYYFKHGTSGLSDVFLLGIKEIGGEAPVALMSNEIQSGMRQVMQGLSSLVFPAGSIQATPIAIYRVVKNFIRADLPSAI